MNYQQIEAELYDVYVADWPGEIAFYQSLIAEKAPTSLLEIACGTGRISLRLAEHVQRIVGLDASVAMLDIARRKTPVQSTICWVEGDMRSFELGENFDLIISPGHSFQFMLTPSAQVQCLIQIREHLRENGMVVIHLDHQDIVWLGELTQQTEPVFEYGGVWQHPVTGEAFRSRYTWAYERHTQTATLYKSWQNLSPTGEVLAQVDNEPVQLHCIFPHEMTHLAERCGFRVQAVYGDFDKTPLSSTSREMIWVLGRQ